MSTSTAPSSDPGAQAQTETPEEDVIGLYDFFEYFVEMERISLSPYDCHADVCDMYEAAVTGEMSSYQYFVVNMPRRIGKTKILEALALWMFGEFSNAQMIYGSYSDPLVKRSMGFIGRALQKPWYLDLYGDKVHTNKAELITTIEGGSIYGAGTTATVTGFGAGLKEPCGGFIALDDPAKPDEALSKVSSAAVIQNFETTFKGCRNSDKWTPIIVNAQRLGPDDLPGYLQKTYPEKTFTLKFPCIVNGFSMFPDTWSVETTTDLQKTRIGRFVYASQFQQEPIAMGGNLIQVESFRRYDLDEAQTIEWEQLVITVDTAMKAKELNDYSCLQLWGRSTRRAYLIDQAHGKWESPQLLATAIAFFGKAQECYRHSALRMVIEEKASGSGLLQQLQAAGCPAEGIERDIDKVRRVQAVLPYQEAGLVYIPKINSCEWVDGFLQECAEFKPDMTHAHDDRVDTFADGVSLLLGEPISILDLLGARPRH